MRWKRCFGRHRADIQKVTGVYAAAYDSAEGWDKLKAEIAAFAEQQGRRPRVMIAKLGQDGHDRGAKVVATAFADLGFDVDMGPLFQTPEECARQAIENDVHAVGVSTLAAGHKTLVPAIIAELKPQGADDIIVFVGGVIPAAGLRLPLRGRREGHLRPGHADPGQRQGRAGPPSAAPSPKPSRCWSPPAPTTARRPMSCSRRCCRTRANQFRLGISGVPGVGKSTFIEAGPVPDRARPPRGGADH
jgi:methylmalonyl-CoA mutase cobalamin-binding domain/chain